MSQNHFFISHVCSSGPSDVVDSEVITISRQQDRLPGKLKQFAILVR